MFWGGFFAFLQKGTAFDYLFAWLDNLGSKLSSEAHRESKNTRVVPLSPISL